MSEPVRKDVVVRGLLDHTHIKDYRCAEIILDRLTVVSITDGFIRIMQRLNPARPGRCPCCGYRSAWHDEAADDATETIMSQPPGDE